MDTRTTNMADLAERICARVASCTDEAKTKAYAIVPAFRAWGWDETDPQQVVPEVPFRLPGNPSPTWCDYAFMVDGQQAVLIEAKAYGKDLAGEYPQLHGYFGQSRSGLAILTDGRTWRFYSDLDFPNQLDHEPFRVIDMCNLREGDKDFLRAFRREGFEAAAIRGLAEDARLRERGRGWLDKTLANPSDELVRFAMKESEYTGRKGQAEIESWRAGIRSAFADVKGVTLAIDKERTDVTGSEYHSLHRPLRENGPTGQNSAGRAAVSRPDGFRLWGQEYPARYWKDVWVTIAETLYARHPDRFRAAIGSHPNVHLERQGLRSPVKLSGSEYWLECHGNADAMRSRSVRLLKLCGYTEADVEFRNA